MPILSGSNLKVDLGNGFELRAPGIKGEANALPMPVPGMARAARALEADDGEDGLARALEATNLAEIKRIELKLEKPVGIAPAQALRSTDTRQDVAELLVPAPEK